MTKVEEIEQAVDALPEDELREFRRWFLERDWRSWDEQIASDSEESKLDFLVREAAEEKGRGELSAL